MKIGDEELGVLIDGGASVNIMSKEVARKLGLKIDSQSKMTRLTLGDGRKIFTNEAVRGVGLNFGKLKVIVDFLILKMPDYQLLLGRGFLKQVNATTDWKNSLFKFEHEGVRHEFVDGTNARGLGALKLIEAEEDYIDRDLRTMESVTEISEGIEEVLEENEEVFGPLSEVVKIGSCHKLEVIGKPVKHRAYRVSPGEDNFIQQEIEKLLKMGIIQPSKSPWASPVVLAGKKDGTMRFA